MSHLIDLDVAFYMHLIRQFMENATFKPGLSLTSIALIDDINGQQTEEACRLR